MIKENSIYKNNIRLNQPRHVLKLLARVTNILLADGITENKAKSIGYLCNIMLKGFETAELAERVESLEKVLKSRGDDNEYVNK